MLLLDEDLQQRNHTHSKGESAIATNKQVRVMLRGVLGSAAMTLHCRLATPETAAQTKC
jgi:hypothetical protein